MADTMTDTETLLAQSARYILNEALMSEFGITVELQSIGDLPALPNRAKQILYRFKAENTDFANLQIKFSPTGSQSEVWIIKQS